MILLSIIYCTARPKTNLDRVKKLLPAWAEIVINRNKGESPLGCYRQDCVNRAKGKYVAVIDDDDDISDDYFDEMKKGIEKGVDCVSIIENVFDDGKFLGLASSGFKNPRLSELYEKYVCNHKDAIKKELVVGCGGYDVTISRFEDFDLAIRLYPFIKTAHYIDHATYNYQMTKLNRLYDKHPKGKIRGFQLPTDLLF